MTYVVILVLNLTAHNTDGPLGPIDIVYDEEGEYKNVIQHAIAGNAICNILDSLPTGTRQDA
jgi:hypothetical protein